MYYWFLKKFCVFCLVCASVYGCACVLFIAKLSGAYAENLTTCTRNRMY